MMEFIVLALAVMVGSLGATGVVLAIVLNKKILKAYTMHVLKVSEEIQDEILDKILNDEF